MILLLAFACIAMVIAGCTSSQSATTPAATAAPQATQVSGAAAAPAAPSGTDECPDWDEKGVWDYSWDTRYMSYAGNHDIRTISEGQDGQPDSWTGINSPPVTDLKLTQKCRDVTGIIVFGMDPKCSGTVTGTVQDNQVTGSWKTDGCEMEDKSTDGKFTITLAADNKTWIGKLIGTEWVNWCPDCPPNWAGRRL